MIIVIVITGIIGGMVAMFIRAPVQGYVDSARRAEMTDIADTALRRLGRDLRTAVPNSIRVTGCGGVPCVEFLPTRDGGRYRVADAGGALCGGSALNDALSFDAADTCFEIVGSPIIFTAGDGIVVGSTQSSGNPPYCQATSCVVGGVTEPGALRIYTGAVSAQPIVVMAGAAQFHASSELEGRRFEVVPAAEKAVTYACLNLGTDGNGDGTGTLTRYWAYGFNVTQAAPAALGGTTAILAQRVSACNFVYDTTNQRNSLLAVSLTITRSNESVNLYHEVHINNIP
jgi:MSHA biogenesis protein MshO